MTNTSSKSYAYFSLFILVIFYALVDVLYMLVSLKYIPNTLQLTLTSFWISEYICSQIENRNAIKKLLLEKLKQELH